MVGDWAKGPGGAGTYSMIGPGWAGIENHRGQILESWELVDDRIFMLYIRPGIRWHDKPPVNGRELTSEDVALCLELKVTPERCPTRNIITFCPKGFESVEIIDRYTVKVVCPPERIAGYMQQMLTQISIKPWEMYENDGDMSDWEDSIGTGAFMLTDYVMEQVAVLERNPNYWDYDPLHPENQLPYLDRVRMLVIQDLAVQQAALKTGKVDWLEKVDINQGDTILKTNPELQSMEFLSHSASGMYLNMQGRVAPFMDIRVRQALKLAIDQQGILRDYLGSRGTIFNAWVPPYPENAGIYTSFEDAPEDIRTLYEYHPDMAREYLAEAGYPNGFSFTCIVQSTYAEELAIFQQYWAAVGIDVDIQIIEATAFSSKIMSLPEKTYDACYTTIGTAVPRTQPQWFWEYRPNYTGDWYPGWEAANEFIQNNWFDPAVRDAKVIEIQNTEKRECRLIAFPSAYDYRMWSPWVGGYHGEYACGNQTRFNWTQYIWVNSALKRQMTGRE